MLPDYFNQHRNSGALNLTNFFASAVLMRALGFLSDKYLQAWKTIMGADGVQFAAPPTGWPPRYVVISHPQGTVVCIEGIANAQQFARIVLNERGTTFYSMPGVIATWSRLMFQQIMPDIMAKIAASTNPNRVVFIGHSAGASLAAMMFKHYAYLLGENKVCWLLNMGPARFSDETFNAIPLNKPQAFALKVEGDSIPEAPLGFVAGLAMPGLLPLAQEYRHYGQRIGLSLRGRVQTLVSYDWRDSDGLDFLRHLTAGNFFTFPEEHNAGSYADALRATQGSPSNGTLADLIQLNGQMKAGLDPDDDVTPIGPAPTTPSTDPAVPTVPQIRLIPVWNGDPAIVPPPAPITTYQPAGVVMQNRMVNSSSIEPKTRMKFGVKDQKKIKHVLDGIELVASSDGDLLKPGASKFNSSGLQIIDRSDETTADAFDGIVDYLKEVKDLDKLDQPIT